VIEATWSKISLVLFELLMHVLACVVTPGVVGLINRLANLVQTIHHLLENGLQLWAIGLDIVLLGWIRDDVKETSMGASRQIMWLQILTRGVRIQRALPPAKSRLGSGDRLVSSLDQRVIA
jgi:hypothetical protein